MVYHGLPHKHITGIPHVTGVFVYHLYPSSWTEELVEAKYAFVLHTINPFTQDDDAGALDVACYVTKKYGNL